MSLNRRKLLVIGCMWPESRSSAAGSYLLQLIEQLQQAGCVLHFASAATPGERRDDLAARGIVEHPIALNCSSFDSFISDLAPDMVLFDRFMTEEQFGWRVEQHAPHALRILQTSDLHALRAVREKALKHAENDHPVMHSPAELGALLQREPLALREVTSILRCDLSLMISPREIELLTQFLSVPVEQLCYCPFLIDWPPVARPNFDERSDFATIGNFLHAPNWDSLRWLKTAIWPRIRQTLPTAKLHIYGAHPTAKALQLHHPQQGFLLHGACDDSVTTLAQARVCLSPLRFGAGIKGKFIDAALAQTPAITTSIGAEGMGEAVNWPGIIANTANAIADVAVALHSEQESWLAAQAKCQEFITANFARDVYGTALIEAIASAYRELEARRERQFLGRLIRQNHLRASEYMARWIEAKNKSVSRH